MPEVVTPLGEDNRGRPRVPRDPSAGLKPWEPKEIKARDRQMAALKALGWKNKDIARAMDLTQSRVSVIVNDPRVEALTKQYQKAYLEDVFHETGDYIRAHSLEMAKNVVSLARDADSENVRLAASKDILDRAGFKPREQVQLMSDGLTDDQVSRIADVLRESQQEPEPLEMIEDSAGVFKAKDSVISARKD